MHKKSIFTRGSSHCNESIFSQHLVNMLSTLFNIWSIIFDSQSNTHDAKKKSTDKTIKICAKNNQCLRLAVECLFYLTPGQKEGVCHILSYTRRLFSYNCYQI